MGKELNNKGFTLIELLAVIVILAVIMAMVAMPVLGTQSKSKGEMLANSADKMAQGFSTSYMETAIGGDATNIYQDIVVGYDFTNDSKYYISDKLEDHFSIDPAIYTLSSSVAIPDSDIANGVDKSFVSFKAETGKFTVCLFAEKSGKYYAANYVRENSIDIGATGLKNKPGTMYACSDGSSSWSAE